MFLSELHQLQRIRSNQLREPPIIRVLFKLKGKWVWNIWRYAYYYGFPPERVRKTAKSLMKVDISIDFQTSYFTNASQWFYRFSRLTLYCVTLVVEDDEDAS